MKKRVTIENYRDVLIQDNIRQELTKIMRERRLTIMGVSKEAGINRGTMDKFIKGMGPIAFKPICAIEDWIIDHIIED